MRPVYPISRIASATRLASSSAYMSVVDSDECPSEGAGCEMSVAENNSSNSRIHILT